MSILDQLIPEARSLSREDKLRLVQLLVNDLAGDSKDEIAPKQAYPVWSPDSAFSAADVMLDALAGKSRT